MHPRLLSLVAFSLTASAMTVLSPATAGDLYKWTDDKGRVHYSSTPPPGNTKKAVTLDSKKLSNINLSTNDPSKDRADGSSPDNTANTAESGTSDARTAPSDNSASTNPPALIPPSLPPSNPPSAQAVQPAPSYLPAEQLVINGLQLGMDASQAKTILEQNFVSAFTKFRCSVESSIYPTRKFKSRHTSDNSIGVGDTSYSYYYVICSIGDINNSFVRVKIQDETKKVVEYNIEGETAMEAIFNIKPSDKDSLSDFIKSFYESYKIKELFPNSSLDEFLYLSKSGDHKLENIYSGLVLEFGENGLSVFGVEKIKYLPAESLVINGIYLGMNASEAKIILEKNKTLLDNYYSQNPIVDTIKIDKHNCDLITRPSKDNFYKYGVSCKTGTSHLVGDGTGSTIYVEIMSESQKVVGYYIFGNIPFRALFNINPDDDESVKKKFVSAFYENYKLKEFFPKSSVSGISVSSGRIDSKNLDSGIILHLDIGGASREFKMLKQKTVSALQQREEEVKRQQQDRVKNFKFN